MTETFAEHAYRIGASPVAGFAGKVQDASAAVKAEDAGRPVTMWKRYRPEWPPHGRPGIRYPLQKSLFPCKFNL